MLIRSSHVCVEQLLQISKRYEKLIKPGKAHFSSAHVHRDQMKTETIRKYYYLYCKMKICYATAICTHTGGLIRFYNLIWSL